MNFETRKSIIANGNTNTNTYETANTNTDQGERHP